MGVYMCCKHYIYTIIQNSEFWILQYNIKVLMLKKKLFLGENLICSLPNYSETLQNMAK